MNDIQNLEKSNKFHSIIENASKFFSDPIKSLISSIKFGYQVVTTKIKNMYQNITYNITDKNVDPQEKHLEEHQNTQDIEDQDKVQYENVDSQEKNLEQHNNTQNVEGQGIFGSMTKTLIFFALVQFIGKIINAGSSIKVEHTIKTDSDFNPLYKKTEPKKYPSFTERGKKLGRGELKQTDEEIINDILNSCKVNKRAAENKIKKANSNVIKGVLKKLEYKDYLGFSPKIQSLLQDAHRKHKLEIKNCNKKLDLAIDIDILFKFYQLENKLVDKNKIKKIGNHLIKDFLTGDDILDAKLNQVCVQHKISITRNPSTQLPEIKIHNTESSGSKGNNLSTTENSNKLLKQGEVKRDNTESSGSKGNNLSATENSNKLLKQGEVKRDNTESSGSKGNNLSTTENSNKLPRQEKSIVLLEDPIENPNIESSDLLATEDSHELLDQRNIKIDTHLLGDSK